MAGDRLIAQLGQGGATAAVRAEIHLRLAHAAVDGTRWEAATKHLDAAKDVLAAGPQPALSARAAVLDAEVAFAANDVGRARRRADSVLAAEHTSPDVRCHALELLGRVQRINDLDAARDTFERALAVADAPGWLSGDCARCTSLAPSRCSTTPAPNASPRPGAAPTSSAPSAPARSSTSS